MPEQNNSENVKLFLSNSPSWLKKWFMRTYLPEIWWWLLVVLPHHGSSSIQTVHLSGVKQVLEFPQHPDEDR